VVDRDGLENRCTGNGTVGSNPTLSAILRESEPGTELRLRLLRRVPGASGAF
jgi:hypothetical protein